MLGAIDSFVSACRYRDQKRLILNSGLFDEEWYKLAHPYVVRDGADPLTHFLKNGKKYKLSPGPAFDTARYLDQHDTARLSSLNPLIHYVRYGRAKGLEIHAAPPSPADRIIASGLFDAAWYRARYPDIFRSGLSPLMHYLIHGAYQQRSPGPDFDAEWYLANYPDVVGRDPLLHFVDHGRVEGRAPLRPTRIIKLAMRTVADVYDLEPELYAVDIFEQMERFPVRNGRAGHRTARVFETVIEALKEPPRAIVFIPWLIHGGADLVACHAVRALAETHGAARVLVILTDHDKEEARHLLPDDVTLLSFSRIDAELTLSERTDLIDLLVRTLQPGAILNVNSRACWEVVKLYGSRLTYFTKLYAMLFCPDFSISGRRNGYSDIYLRECLPHLSGIYFDNQYYITELTKQFSIPPELHVRLVSLHQPTPSIPAVKRERRSAQQLNVLWAGRLTFQKNIDLLVAIAESAPQFMFHIWGRGEREIEQALKDLTERCPNVRFYGPFDRFNALPLADYDALLYTSRWDGLPNILLEAAGAQLPIIASNVGGIKELVDFQTGWLIDDVNNPEAYIEALHVVDVDKEEVARRGEGMQQRLTLNHNWQNYCDILTREPSSTGGLLNASTDDYCNSNSAS